MGNNWAPTIAFRPLRRAHYIYALPVLMGMGFKGPAGMKTCKKKKLVKKYQEQNRTYGVVIDDARHSNFVLTPRTSFTNNQEESPPWHAVACEGVGIHRCRGGF